MGKLTRAAAVVLEPSHGVILSVWCVSYVRTYVQLLPSITYSSATPPPPSRGHYIQIGHTPSSDSNNSMGCFVYLMLLLYVLVVIVI